MSARDASKKVSVLIPTYKYARYLPQAIESILNQSYGHFELIISDDDSNDGSAEIIRAYAAKDDRIRFKIQSPNLGIGHNWNWCLEQATGRYIKYVFGDDFLVNRDALAQFVALLESGPDISLAASARIVVDEHSNPIETWNHIGEPGVFDGSETINWCLRTNCNLIGEPSVVMFRRESAAKPFDTTFKQVLDWDFWIHLLQRGNLAYTSEPLCAFRRHPLQQTEVNRLATGEGSEHQRLMELYLKYFVLSSEAKAESFSRLYRLRKKREHHPDDLMFISVLTAALGHDYYPYLLRYRAMRLIANLQRVWQKHLLGKPIHETSSVRIPEPLRPLARL